MTGHRRGSDESFHQRFQEAFAAWQGPALNDPAGSPAGLAKILGSWAAERAEDAEQVQQLATAVATLCLVKGEYLGAAPVVAAGLEASMLGAPGGAERSASAAWLALLGATLAFEADDVAGARVLVDRAGDSADRLDPTGPLDGYLRLHRSLIEARLAEAAREARTARRGYSIATNLAAALGEANHAEALLTPWATLAFGVVGQPPPEAASLLRRDLVEAAKLAALGLARTSAEPGPARDAVDRCTRDGLPLAEPVLALSGLLDGLPAEEIDEAAERLAVTTASIEEPRRASWLIAVRAAQAQAWLAHGEFARAVTASELALNAGTARHDPLAAMMAVSSQAAARYATGDARSAWADTALLLELRAQTAARLDGSRLELQARAACEPALAAALQNEAGGLGDGSDPRARRRAAVLIDALRAAEDAPPATVGTRDAASLIDRAEWLADDRIGRLAHQANQAADVLVLIVQSLGTAVSFIAVGPGDQFLATVPAADSRRRLASLSSYAEQTVTSAADDNRLVTLGRAAFETMPALIRQRLSQASIVVVVPDLSAGLDRTPFELLHDGSDFLGVSKVVCRCLSLSHALRVLEPAQAVTTAGGRRALCVAVGNPPGLPPLPHATAEVSRVEAALNYWWNSETLLESDATPDQILELAPLAHVLHVACHGDSAAGAEALVLGGGARLRANDIATRHRLRGFTYLNACSLGGGRYVGGGLSRGVAYAFARAGSPSVVANLLPVADRSAAELAEAFYSEARDHPVGEALRRARGRLSGRVSAALWSTTVLIGDPFRHLDGTSDRRPDETAGLFGSEPRPAPELLKAAHFDAADVRLAAAIDLATALSRDKAPLDRAARVARELGLDITEAHCLVELATTVRESPDVTEREQVLRDAVKALEPLRGQWVPAYRAHRDLLRELRSLDPGYRARKLETFKFDSGLTVNDRSHPAVDTILSMYEAQFEHETFWRGEPELIVPDLDIRSIAHNAVVWGYKHRLHGIGAEPAYARACTERLAWRGLLAEDAVPHLHRLWAGILHFLWGQQYVTHLQGWMLRAHTRVLEIAVERAGQYWVPPESSPAFPYASRIATLLDAADTPPDTRSPFARVRAALDASATGAPDPASTTATTIQEAVRHCRATDEYAAADLGAWMYGDLLQRDIAAVAHPGRRQQVLTYRTILDELDSNLEGWIWPYLMEGFAGERETGGMDVLGRWSNEVL